MMDPEERAALALLPDRLTIYRGCYPVNRPGRSWFLNREIATQIPYKHRYRGPSLLGHSPILRTGTVARSRAVLKLDRKEGEIIAAYVCITGESLLDPHR
jgi:hypothetical protein